MAARTPRRASPAVASQASDRLSLHQRLQSETRQARLPHGHPLGDFPELPGPARDFPACVPAELAGPRLAVVPGSQPEALEAGPALPAGCRRDPQGLGSWGYSTCPQRPLVPSKSITTSPTLPGRPCPKASSLDSPGQQQCRPVHRWDPSVPLPHGGPWTGIPLPGGAQRDLCVQAWRLIRAEHACCPPAPRLLHSRGQAVLAKGRPREPEAHDVESGRRTGTTTGQGPGPGAGREEPQGPRVPTLELMGPALRRTLRTARICPRLGGCSVVWAALGREQVPCRQPCSLARGLCRRRGLL